MRSLSDVLPPPGHARCEFGVDFPARQCTQVMTWMLVESKRPELAPVQLCFTHLQWYVEASLDLTPLPTSPSRR